MKKLLYLTFYSSATEFYRSSGVFPYLDIENVEITRSNNTNINFDTLIDYDIIMLERPSSGAEVSIIRLAKDMGKKVIVDYDDDCLHLDNLNPMYEVYLQEMENVLDALSLSDEVWVTTEGLKKAYSLYNNNIHVIPNAHNDYMFPVKDKKTFNLTAPKKAMWRGGQTHEGDIYDLGIPEKLIEVINSNPEWDFLFIGQRFKYLEIRCGDNYISQQGATPIQFYKMMHEENPQIFFYPLADTVFNRSKSNIAWLESTYAGAAFFGNNNLPEFSHDSIISFDYFPEYFEKYAKVDYWATALKQANKEAWEEIRENYLLSKVNNLRKERIIANL